MTSSILGASGSWQTFYCIAYLGAVSGNYYSLNFLECFSISVAWVWWVSPQTCYYCFYFPCLLFTLLMEGIFYYFVDFMTSFSDTECNLWQNSSLLDYFNYMAKFFFSFGLLQFNYRGGVREMKETSGELTETPKISHISDDEATYTDVIV